jgi:threonine/homoserine/homoserine lactone efflux protein
MSHIEFLLKGIFLGFCLAAPVGPIGLLCIQRTLYEGRLTGFVSGLGATAADVIYGCIAGFGIAFVANFLTSQQQWLRLIGGAFICYLGIKIFFTKPAERAAANKNSGLLGAFLSTFFLMLTNPITIAVFMAMFAGIGATSAGGDYLAVAALVLGISLGSALWWLLLCGGVSLFRAKLTPERMRWINRIAGIIIVGFGVTALRSLKS